MLSNARLNILGRGDIYSILFGNQSPHSALTCKTLKEVWSDSPFDYFNLRIFDCAAYIYVSKGKLEHRAKKCNFIGYASRIKGHRLWCSESSNLLISRNITFDESTMLYTNRNSPDETSSAQMKVETDGIVQS